MRSRLQVCIEQRAAPTRGRAKLLDAQPDRAAQIGAFKIDAFKIGLAHDGPGQHRAAQVGILEIGIQKNAALELRASQVRSDKFRRRKIRIVQIGERQDGSFELRIANVRARKIGAQQFASRRSIAYIEAVESLAFESVAPSKIP